jgi:hypothetical protein
MFADVP